MDKQPFSPQKRGIAAAAVTAALLGTFGVGVYFAAQSGGAFDPQGLVSNYGDGSTGASKGYRMNPTQQEGDANRHKEQSESQEKSAEDTTATQEDEDAQTASDAFSQSNGARTATAAYSVTGDADDTGVTVSNGATTNSQPSQASDAANGDTPVIVVPSTNGGGTSKGDSGKGDADNADADKGNSGTKTDADKKDDSGSKGDAGSGDKDKGDGDSGKSDADDKGDSGKGDDSGKTDPDPTPSPSPTDNSYSILPNDPSPSKDNSVDTSVFPNKAGTAESSKAEQATSDEVVVNITPSATQSLYHGQKLDAWTIFCALSTTYSYTSPDTCKSTYYRWDCTKNEFASYPYFQVVSWTDEAGNKNPELCPEGDVTATVRYRFAADGTWREQTVTCTPQASRVYILGQAKADGAATILGWTESTAFNLLTIGAGQFSYEEGTTDLGTSLTERALRDLGYINDDDSLNHLLLGWQEAGQDLGHLYSAAPGRHVIQPSGFVGLADGYTARLQHYVIQYDGETTIRSSTLQTLIDVDESVLTGDGENELVLTVPDGIEAVDEYREDKERAASWSLSRVELPASVLYFNPDGPFTIQNAYQVSDENEAYASTADGILTSKDGESYLGIPAALTELDVPSGVGTVKVQKANSLSRIAVHGTNGEPPSLQTDNLSDCVIVVDDDVFEAFIEKNYDGLAAADDRGVEVCRASDTDARYICSGGMVYSEDDLVRVHNNGSDTVFVQIPTTIKAGAFEGATDVTCVVLFNDEDCVLEAGSLSGGNVQTIVCFTEAQAEGVKAQLAAAGAPDAHVILARASQEEMLYYVDGEKVTLLSDQGFASTFNGTVTDEDGNAVEVNAIAPYAFAGDTDLAWVTLGPSVTSIGAYAFQGCESLQGLFIGATDEVAVGAGALDGCEALGFVASLSSNATFATHEVPNNGCSWYCLPDSSGHDSRFTRITDINSLSVGEQADGSLVLYGAEGADDEPTLVLSGGTSYEGTLTLPSSIVEIFTGAFSGTGGSWYIDWSSAPNLQWIDRGAFQGSGISGDIVIDSADGRRESITIGTSAFERCADITSFTIDVPEVEIGFTSFAGCGSLQSVSIQGDVSTIIAASSFSSCSSLTSLSLGSETPARLNCFTPGAGFTFTDGAEEDERISLSVPEGSEESYLASWVYRLVGYDDYDSYYSEVEWGIFEETWEFPSETEVRERMAENLLEPENRLRRMMGLDEVEASTIVVNNTQVVDGFTYTAGDDGAFTLISAPADATEVSLDDVLPEGCGGLAIGASAFAECEGLGRVELGSHVTAIQTGAFEGCDGVTVVLPAGAAQGISLSGGSSDTPFDFGAQVALEVDADDQQAVLAAWPMQCLGYADEFELGDWVFDLIWDYFDYDDPTSEAVAYINECLLEQENCLRGLMGLDAIETTDELAYRYSYDLDW